MEVWHGRGHPPWLQGLCLGEGGERGEGQQGPHLKDLTHGRVRKIFDLDHNTAVRSQVHADTDLTVVLLSEHGGTGEVSAPAPRNRIIGSSLGSFGGA